MASSEHVPFSRSACRHRAICSSTSNILHPPEFGQRPLHEDPLFFLLLKRLRASPAQRVVLPLPARLGRAPARGNVPLLLEPVQHRIKHAFGPLDGPAGEFADTL